MKYPTAKIRTSILEFINALNHSVKFFCIFSDSENDNKSYEKPPDNTSSLRSKRRVTFQSSKETDLNNKSSTKVHQRRIRTTKRSFDQRISFSGRNAIYTAGI